MDVPAHAIVRLFESSRNQFMGATAGRGLRWHPPLTFGPGAMSMSQPQGREASLLVSLLTGLQVQNIRQNISFIYNNGPVTADCA